MKKTVWHFVSVLFLMQSCATFRPQYSSKQAQDVFPEDKKVAHTFYLVGDAGDGLFKENNSLKDHLLKANSNSTLLFLGDNIYPFGMPKKESENRADAESKIQSQLDMTLDFKGKTIFIPGNHDWYSGLDGLKREQEFIEKQLGKKSFLPKNGCPLTTLNITADIVLIVVDSQWYFTNWDEEPAINEDCDIKTKNQFLEAFGAEIKKARGKTTLVAIHHPLFSNGPHGGHYSFKSHLSPLPLFGSLKNLFRKTAGLSNADLQNKNYNDLKKNLEALAQQNDKVIFISGHEHSLQYLVQSNLHQIISGSGSKVSPTHNTNASAFSYGTMGYAIVDVFEDGSSFVRFITSPDNQLVYQSRVLLPDTKKQNSAINTSLQTEIKCAIYDVKTTEKSNYYKFLWGQRYRDTYSTPVTAQTVNLDTLFGGLTPLRKGGGNQSKALRLKTKSGKQYVIRALKKNASQYIQAAFFKDQFVENKFKNTGSEAFVMDVFTGSYPYGVFIVPGLSDAVGLYHLNPKLYYIPKQAALGDFNDEFGNELYLLEEQPSEGNFSINDPDFTGKINSTPELLEELHADANKSVDQTSYIRARLFDMLINDWDRHQDQWRWLEFKENGKTRYKPLARDRDQAFSKMSDGVVLGAVVKLMPPASLLQKYQPELNDVAGFNLEPFPLDKALIYTNSKAIWDEQVAFIQKNLTPEKIDAAFLNIPKELNNQTLASIKQTLNARKDNLQKIADQYFYFLNKYAVITATKKDDYIKIICNKDSVTVSLYRKKKEGNELFFNQTYTAKTTKELWVYGLDDKDAFEVTGRSKKIKIRLIGGQNNDQYTIEDGKNIVIYDYKSKKNTLESTSNATLKLRDNYNQNNYDYKKIKTFNNQISPLVGFNPDDGLKLGINTIYTLLGFERNPFTANHQLKAGYFFATKGYELNYKGEFANAIGKLNLVVQSGFHSANFSQNFFGYGNETSNEDKKEGLNYNRVKVGEFTFAPSLVWKAKGGANLFFELSYQAIDVEKTKGRFVEISNQLPQNSFDRMQFVSVNSKFQFENYDNKAYPTLGMATTIELGFTTNSKDNSRNFVYLKPEISFDHKIDPAGKLILATQIKSQILFNSNFEFYQAASIGGNDGLRGFRNQRFAGQQSLYQNTDLRYTFESIKTNIIPIRLGVYGGFDYGRVWVQSNPSQRWNNAYGGGFFANGAELLTANLGLFHSIDGLRIAFSLGFQF